MDGCKKLITAALALVALAAFALPATASAATPVLTHPTGTALATGKKITGHLLGVSKLTSTTTSGAGEPLVECSSATMTGELTKNNGTEIEGTIETASFTGTEAENKCKGLGGVKVTTAATANGTPWCLRATAAMNPNEFQVRGGACGAATHGITFLMDTGLGVNCAYERTTALKGTFTTDTGPEEDAVLTLTGEGETGKSDTGFTREGTNVLCPASGTLDMKFTLETDNPGHTEPLWIS